MTNQYNAQSTLPTQCNYIGGNYVNNLSGDTFVTRHPGNDHVICEIETAGQPEVDQAVAAARSAFDSWSQTPAAERGKILRRAADLLRERNAEIAGLETLDTGKPIAETSVVDVITGAMSIMPITLLLLGGLATLQTATIVAGAPLLIVALLLCISMVKAANFDLRYQPDYKRQEIHIEEFPEEDPWTDEGSWDLEDHNQDRDRPD